VALVETHINDKLDLRSGTDYFSENKLFTHSTPVDNTECANY